MLSSRMLRTGVVFFGGLHLIAIPATAAPLPRLVVVRSSDAADCPDAPALARAVEQHMQRPAFDSTTDPSTSDQMSTNPSPNDTVEVRISRTSDGYAATIRAGDLTRDLSDPGSTCTELGEALALTLAILLDTEAAPPTSTPAPVSTPKPAPATELPRPTPAPKTARLTKPPRDWNVGVDVGLGPTLGFLTPGAFALNSNVWLRYQRASFGAGLFVLPWARVNDTSTTIVDLRLILGSMHACGRILGKPNVIHLSWCGQSFVGAIHGEGVGYPINRAGTRPWLAFGTMGVLEGRWTERLGWSVRMSVAVPVLSQRFTVTRVEGTGADVRETPVTLFEPYKFAAFLGIGLRWTIF